MGLKGIESLGPLQGRRVFLRVDFNVPLRAGAEGQEVADDYRLEMALPTLLRLLKGGARVVIGSHLGRPSEAREPEYSMAPVARRLEVLLERAGHRGGVRFVPATVGPAAEEASRALKDGEALLLDNLRYEKGEKKGSKEFAQALAKLADLYVNDAFGVSHRGDASVALMPGLLPAAAGDLVKTEVEKLTPLRDGTAPRPYVVVLGGAKLADKIPVLEALLPKVDGVFVGGAMAYTFLHAMGKPIGASLCEPELTGKAQEIMELARERARTTGSELVLPHDHVVAKGPKDLTGYAIVDQIPAGLMGLDVGPATIADFAKRLREVKTVFWNGPLGLFEQKPFHLGTHYLASVIGCTPGINAVVGGGDSVAAVRELGLEHTMDWISTGGGASLEFVQGETLPGIAALPQE